MEKNYTTKIIKNKKSKSILENNNIKNIISIGIILLVWQVVYSLVDAKFLLVSPFDAVKNLIFTLCHAEIYYQILYTALRILSGFITAIIVGIIFAIVVYNNNIFDNLIDMVMKIIKITPIVSFIILSLVYMPKVIIVPFISFLVVLPIVYYNVLSSLRSVDRNKLEMANAYDISKTDKIKYIYILDMKEKILSIVESSLGFAFKSGITAEVLVLPKVSIGVMLYNSKIYLDGPMLITYTLVLIISSIAIEKAILLVLRKGIGKING